MIRNLKGLGLALLAVFALGALGAQVASAADSHEFKAEVQKVVLTGSQVGTHQFTIGSVGTVECTTATFESTTDAGPGVTEVDELTARPNYSGCKFGGQAATVFFNDCAFVFDSDTVSGNPTGGKHAAGSLECAPGNLIKVHTVNCTITIGPQTIAQAVSYAPDEKEGKVVPNAVNVNATAHGIVVGKERNTGSQPVNGCLIFPTGAVGKYTGLTTVECRQDEGSAQANPTTPTGTQDAASTNCEVTGL